jgi:hypothetical protein
MKKNSFEMNAIVEDAWNMLDEQIVEIKKLYETTHEEIAKNNDKCDELLNNYYSNIKEIKSYDKICKLTEIPEPYLSHYYVYFANGFVFLRGTGDWLKENEMVIKRTKGSFDERYQPDPTYDQWKDDDDNFFTSDKFTYKRLAWGDRCGKIFEPDFLVTLKK